MTTDILRGYGKTLPVPFALGYITAYERVRGFSVAIAHYQWAACQRIPDVEMMSLWIAPLFSYFPPKKTALQPLDYELLTLFYQGFIADYDQIPFDKKAISLRRIGQVWWSGDAPISTTLYWDSLSVLLTPKTMQKLKEWRVNAPLEIRVERESYRELAVMGFQTLITEFRAQSGVSCRVLQQHSQITVEIEECPICLNHQPSCQVFMGVIEGALAWLHGKHQPYELDTILSINEEQSTGHSIVLDMHV